MASPALFDPFTQSFVLLDSEKNSYVFSIPELDGLILYKVQSSINFGAQLGGSLVLLIVLLLLAKPDKRCSPIFILNAISLSINVVRMLLYSLYFTGPFSDVYAVLCQDFSRVPRSAYVKSVTPVVLSFLLLVCAEISLVLQVRVVCVTLRKIYRQAIFVSSVVIILTPIGFRLALCIENSRYIMSPVFLTDLIFLESATNISTSISVCWFCAVFIAKLAFTLVERRKLGLSNFGPMQVIFIMGIQTFMIPAIFSLFPYFANFPGLSSNVLTLVTIFLPLSSLWAAATVTARSQNTPPALAPPSDLNRSSGFKQRLLGSFTSGTTCLLIGLEDRKAPLSPSATALSQSSSPGHAQGRVLVGDLEK